MSKRINFFFLTFLVTVFAVGGGMVNAPPSHGAEKSQPLDPNTPSSVQPLGPVPSGPTPAGPNSVPAPVYPLGPTAEEDSVRLRSRPEYQPSGFELGSLFSTLGLMDASTAADKRSGLSSFIVFPELEVETSYDSNLFRDQSETSDKILVVSPSLSIRSDWTDHALEFYGAADIGRYYKTITEDYEDYHGRISGRIDLFDNLFVTGSALYGQRHQPRGELIDPGDTSEATVIRRGQLKLGAQLELAALTLSANVETDTRDFVSSDTVDNDDLDRDEHQAVLRASLEVDTGTSLFVQPKYNRRVYDRKIDSAGFEQDSHGYEVLGGVRWDASGVTFVEVGLGYLWQKFDDGRFAIIEGATASADVIWNFSDLWTFTFGLSRTVSETADQDLSGVLNTGVKSRLDYEFLYNTIFSLRMEFTDEDYKSSSRSDDRTIAGFGIKHLFNAHLFAALDIKHENLSSNRDTEDFKATTGTLRLGAQY